MYGRVLHDRLLMKRIYVVAGALVILVTALPAISQPTVQPTVAFGFDVAQTWGRHNNRAFGRGEDVNGAPYIEFRWKIPIFKRWSVNPYFGQALGFFEETVYGFDFAVDIKRWTLGIGATYGEANEIVGSDLQYELRVERSFKGCFAASWVHNSNGASDLDNTFLPHGDPPNKGYNFVMGRLPLYECKEL